MVILHSIIIRKTEGLLLSWFSLFGVFEIFDPSPLVESHNTV